MLYEWPLAASFFIFLFILVGLYYISKLTIKKIFDVLHLFIKSDRIVMYIISGIFLPGTIIHELSHFIMALVLLLRVHDLRIFPEMRNNGIKLGHVIYEKRDIFSGIIVGIAPLIFGISFFWWLYSINLFTHNLWYIQIVKIYIMFVISATMFSSKQDLVDIGYLIPILIIVVFCVYYFNIDIRILFSNQSLIAVLKDFMYSVTVYLGISVIIHVSLIATIQLFLSIHKK